MLWILLLLLIWRTADAEWPSSVRSVRLSKGRIDEIGLSPDGRWLRIGTAAGIWLHDPATLQQVRMWAEPVIASRFSADGRLLAASLADTSIIVWDVAADRVVIRLRGLDDRITTFVFDTDGRRLAAGSRAGEIVVWRLADGMELARMRAETVRDLVFDHPENRLVSASGYRAIRVWDLATSTEVALLAGHEDEVRGLALHPGGRLLASGSQDWTVRLWDLDTLQPLASARPGGQAGEVTFSPSGRWLVVRPTHSALNGVTIYEVTAPGAVTPGFEQRLFLEHTTFVRFATGETTAVMRDTRDGHASFWSIPAWTRRDTLATGAHGVVAATAGGDGLFTVAGGSVYTWSVPGARPTIRLPGFSRPLGQIAMQPGGELVAVTETSSNPRVTLWNRRTLRPVARAELDFGVDEMLFTPDGQRLALAGWRGAILWRLDTRHDIAVTDTLPLPAGVTRLWPAGQLPARLGALVEAENRRGANLRSAAMDPLGRYLAFGWELGSVYGTHSSGGGAITLWDLARNVEAGLLTGTRNAVHRVVFHPSGDFLISTGTVRDPWMRLWQVSTAALVDSFAVSQPPGFDLAYQPAGEVLAIGNRPVFSPAGDLLASAAGAPLLWTNPFGLGDTLPGLSFRGDPPPFEGRRGLPVWSTEDFTPVATLTGHRGGVNDLAFNDAGDLLGSVDGDGLFLLQGAIDVLPAAGLFDPVVLSLDTAVQSPDPQDDTPDPPDSAFVVTPALHLFPNPARDRVTITYNVLRGGSVRVEIYDILGRRVRTLVDAALEPAPFVTTWSGDDDQGSAVAAGVYIVRVRQPGGDMARRFLRLP